MTSRRRFLRTASALLLATVASPSLAASPATLEIKTPMAPPEWALLERALLKANAEACEALLRPLFRRARLPAGGRALGRQRRSRRRHRERQRLAAPARPGG
jgi:hypothetical protein